MTRNEFMTLTDQQKWDAHLLLSSEIEAADIKLRLMYLLYGDPDEVQRPIHLYGTPAAEAAPMTYEGITLTPEQWAEASDETKRAGLINALYHIKRLQAELALYQTELLPTEQDTTRLDPVLAEKDAPTIPHEELPHSATYRIYGDGNPFLGARFLDVTSPDDRAQFGSLPHR